MATLMQANRQWSSRPDDERFVSLQEMRDHFSRVAAESRAVTVENRVLEVRPAVSDEMHGLEVFGANGVGYSPTNWAFGQLATLAGAPAGYLRTLPAPLAADAMNWGLRHNRTPESVQVLIRKNGERTLRAATGPNYGRIYYRDVIDALIQSVGDGVSGQWRVPGEFGRAVHVTKTNTTLFGSDRDIFIFLADEQNRIEVPNRRDGKSGSMARGVFVWNSEEGSKTLGLGTFLFDYVCCNRIVWGASDYKQINIRHTSGAPSRWLEEVKPALLAYAESSSARMVHTIKAAQAAKVDKVEEFLANRFGKRLVEPLKAAHLADEGRPIETLWDASTAVTAYARGISTQDDRVAFERKGGEILALAS